MRIAVVSILIVALVGGGLAVAYFSPEPAYSNDELRAFGFVGYPEPRHIDGFDLVDVAGGRFNPERLRGRWSLVFFGYANCPDICPLTMSVLAKAERRLLAAGDSAFQAVLVSVDPERDTPAALAGYVGAFSDNFVGVTGPVADIKAFGASLHAGFSKAPVADSALGYLMDHSSHVAVIDPGGRHYGFIRSPLDVHKIATLTRALALRWPEAQPPG